MPKSPPASAAGHPYVPRMSPEELVRRGREVQQLLGSWEQEGEEQEQRETLAILVEALGRNRVAASRTLFP